MDKYIGQTDKWVRLILGLVFIYLGSVHSPWWFLLGVILIVTGLMEWCMIYDVLGYNTCQVKTVTEIKEVKRARITTKKAKKKKAKKKAVKKKKKKTKKKKAKKKTVKKKAKKKKTKKKAKKKKAKKKKK